MYPCKYMSTYEYMHTNPSKHTYPDLSIHTYTQHMHTCVYAQLFRGMYICTHIHIRKLKVYIKYQYKYFIAFSFNWNSSSTSFSFLVDFSIFPFSPSTVFSPIVYGPILELEDGSVPMEPAPRAKTEFLLSTVIDYARVWSFPVPYKACNSWWSSSELLTQDHNVPQTMLCATTWCENTYQMWEQLQ